jgi:hypothetical protein
MARQSALVRRPDMSRHLVKSHALMATTYLAPPSLEDALPLAAAAVCVLQPGWTQFFVAMGAFALPQRRWGQIRCARDTSGAKVRGLRYAAQRAPLLACERPPLYIYPSLT